MDIAEVFNLRTRHVLRFHYISLILHHTQNVSLIDVNYINNDIQKYKISIEKQLLNFIYYNFVIFNVNRLLKT